MTRTQSFIETLKQDSHDYPHVSCASAIVTSQDGQWRQIKKHYATAFWLPNTKVKLTIYFQIQILKLLGGNVCIFFNISIFKAGNITKYHNVSYFSNIVEPLYSGVCPKDCIFYKVMFFCWKNNMDCDKPNSNIHTYKQTKWWKRDENRVYFPYQVWSVFFSRVW